MAPIDTGFANQINNDHGISPDGSLLVISDESQFNASCIYTVPATGGIPTQVTDNVPSYWHGWSPDGSTLVYVANRGAGYQVFACPAEGGTEVPLTAEFDHCDGPDYTPDGRWIWFNGERDQSVQLWRMHTDGSNLQQMTHDDRVNWFPHPSPNGEQIVYLAYPSNTQGHPANRSVQLRLTPSEGGEPKVLTSFTGGQGTINVPSWSPDGTQFAFVRYLDTLG